MWKNIPLVYPPHVEKYSTEVVHPPPMWINIPLSWCAPPFWINIPLRWCTPPPLDKYSTEVVCTPLRINIPLRWCTPPPLDKYSTEVV